MTLNRLPAQKRDGAWVPTLVAVANLDDLTLLNAFFAISGDVVECSLAVNVDPTLAAAWSFRATLPFGISLAAESDLIGVLAPAVSGGFGGTVRGDTTNNQALLEGQMSTEALDVYAQFAYRIP